jgi:hypothetical protein
MLLLILRCLLLSLQLRKLLPRLLQRLSNPLLLSFSLGRLLLQFDQMLPKHPVLLAQQLQALFQLRHLLVLPQTYPLDQFDDLLIFSSDRLPENLVLADEHLGQLGSFGKLQHPTSHVTFQSSVVPFQIEDDLGEVGVSIGDDPLLLVLLVSGLRYELGVKVSNELALSVDLLYVLGDFG